MAPETQKQGVQLETTGKSNDAASKGHIRRQHAARRENVKIVQCHIPPELMVYKLLDELNAKLSKDTIGNAAMFSCVLAGAACNV